MVAAYVRVSTTQQDVENQKNVILRHANSNGIIVNEFIDIQMSSKRDEQQRKITELLEKDNINILIVTELSRLGRSVTEVVTIVNRLVERKVRLISIKENIDIKDSYTIQSKVMITMFGLFAELERDLISQRTRGALQTKKNNGVKLGRPKGYSKSSLDPHKNDIILLLKKGVSINAISKIINVNYPTLWQYIHKRKLKQS
jgi:DNA invertase Pin-like site-specific DNA recombinase